MKWLLLEVELEPAEQQVNDHHLLTHEVVLDQLHNESDYGDFSDQESEGEYADDHPYSYGYVRDYGSLTLERLLLQESHYFFQRLRFLMRSSIFGQASRSYLRALLFGI